MKETISVRIPKGAMKEIEVISKGNERKKSEILREVIKAGIREKKLELALEKFLNKEITAWKAARLADIPLTKFLDILKARDIEIHYTKDELEEEFHTK